MIIRSYTPSDYEQLKSLYLDTDTFGGQFDEVRDASDRLQKKIEADPDAILVAEDGDKIVGSVSLIEDGRVAWLFRFAVPLGQAATTQALHDKAVDILKARGHSQVLVYTPSGNDNLNDRYSELSFNKGNDFTCFWKEI